MKLSQTLVSLFLCLGISSCHSINIKETKIEPTSSHKPLSTQTLVEQKDDLEESTQLSLFEQFKLSDISKIEILDFDLKSEDENKAGKLIVDIRDQNLILEIINSLDVMAVETSRAYCPVQRIVHFYKNDDLFLNIALGCEADNPSFMRFSRNESDFRPPQQFLNLIEQAIKLSSSQENSSIYQAVAWYGYIRSAKHEDTSMDILMIHTPELIEFEIQGGNDETIKMITLLRDKAPPNQNAHFWGEVNCDPENQSVCLFLAQNIHLDGPGPLAAPESVDAWEGWIYHPNVLPGSGGDDYFLLDGIYAIQYGIDANVSPDAEQLNSIIEKVSDNHTRIRVNGKLLVGLPDWNGTQIQASTIELLE
ncbi:MAG: hypothetical protein JEZ06_11000 [Anaerolineaceae bacterium]|nr:hypothetical protein [Anaerolineaceae bacterium]